jgi:tetratricopeptide (TPR) repeat protein
VLSYAQQKELFEILCKDVKKRVIVHHWGILEGEVCLKDEEMSHCEKAESLLQSALELPQAEDSYRGESDQNIITSQGTLLSYIAQKYFQKGDENRGKEYLEKAVGKFTGARYGFFPNTHAYHAHANMYKCLARFSKDEAEKAHFFNEATSIIDLGKANSNEGSHGILYELEAEIYGLMENDIALQKTIEVLRDKFNNPNGFLISAKVLINKVRITEQEYEGRKMPPKAIKLMKEKYQKAIKLIKDCLSQFPNNIDALRLMVKVFPELYPDEKEKYYDILRNWYNRDVEKNFEYLFQLAVWAFQLGYYSDARKYFEELEEISSGHYLRFTPRNELRNPNTEDGRFEGIIDRLDSAQRGGYIKCTSLKDLDYRIHFSPFQKFTPRLNQYVSFYIAFNYRGPTATDLNPL